MSDTNKRSVGSAGSVAWRRFSAVILAVACAACVGCDDKDTKRADGVGLKYRVVTVEGRRWIAYQGAHGLTHLAGPID